MDSDYTLCGWRVRSELALPELLPWVGEQREPDVVITVGRVTPPVTPPIHTLPFSQIWPDGGYLFTLETVGRYWVTSGKMVVIEPVGNTRETDVRVFLLGTIFGVLCHQRRLLPLHASAVRMGMGVVVMAGDSGVGKSTLAAGLRQRGHPLVADDTTIIQVSPSHTPMVLPSYPYQKLCLDVLDMMEIPAINEMVNRPGQPKYHIPAHDGFETTPLPLLKMYIVYRRVCKSPYSIEKITQGAAMASLDRMLYRRIAGHQIVPKSELFHNIATLVKTTPMYHLYVNEREALSSLDRLVAAIEEHTQGEVCK